jgi:hypothetical protein
MEEYMLKFCMLDNKVFDIELEQEVNANSQEYLDWLSSGNIPMTFTEQNLKKYLFSKKYLSN